MFRLRELPGPLGVLEPNGAQARSGEGPDVGPHRVDVLVDAELLLVLLLGVRAAPVRRARALVQPRDDAAAPGRRARARRPSRRGRARGGGSPRRRRRRRRRRRTAAARRRPGSEGTGRRAARRTAPRPRPISGSTTRSQATYSQPRGRRCSEAQLFAAPISSTRSPGSTYRSSRSWKPCSVAAQARSSQPRSRFRNGSAASIRSSASYQPCSFASSGQAASSRSFASIPGASRSRRLAMAPSAVAYRRPQERQASDSSSAPRQAGQTTKAGSCTRRGQ